MGIPQIYKIFCFNRHFQTNKKTTHRMEENFCKSGKGTVSRIYEKSLQLNNKKTNNSIKQWAKDLNTPFPRECI